jgi:hypothetical protein
MTKKRKTPKKESLESPQCTIWDIRNDLWREGRSQKRPFHACGRQGGSVPKICASYSTQQKAFKAAYKLGYREFAMVGEGDE